MIPKLFEGIEVEGRHKGKKTLFVQGRVEYSKIANALNGKNYDQVYFGARYKDFSIQPSDVDILVVEKLAKLFGTCIFTVEMNYSFSYIPSMVNVEFIMVIRYINHIFNIVEQLKKLPKNTIQIKLFSDKHKGVLTIPAEQLLFTSESEYERDELIEV